jgi:hypothetical protein
MSIFLIDYFNIMIYHNLVEGEYDREYRFGYKY